MTDRRPVPPALQTGVYSCAMWYVYVYVCLNEIVFVLQSHKTSVGLITNAHRAPQSQSEAADSDLTC